MEKSVEKRLEIEGLELHRVRTPTLSLIPVAIAIQDLILDTRLSQSLEAYLEAV